MNITPLAPMGAVIFEDDVVPCNTALDYLDECFNEQYNCILGYGAWMNFYAGAYSAQPHPDKYSSKRFTTTQQIFAKQNSYATYDKYYKHADWYIRGLNRHGNAVDHVNHLGYTSVLNHDHWDPDRIYHLRCPMEDTLAGNVVKVPRTQDIRI